MNILICHFNFRKIRSVATPPAGAGGSLILSPSRDECERIPPPSGDGRFHVAGLNRLSLIAVLIFVFSSVSFAQGFHFGVISAVKSKVQELKDKKEEASVRVISIDTSTVSALVGSSGGTVTTLDGNASVTIPANALGSNTKITVSANADSFLGQLFTPYEFSTDLTGNFSLPLTISVKYDPSLLPAGMSETDIKLAYIKTTGEQEVLTSKVDTLHHIVSASVNHFSLYCPVVYSAFDTSLGEFNGVTTYSNYHEGTDSHNLNGTGDTNTVFPGTANEYATGQKWTSSEYVLRYYWSYYKRDIKGTSNKAIELWNTARQRGLQQLVNKSGIAAESPIEGDIVVFSAVQQGSHAAIVRKIENNKVHVIQQNWYLNYKDSDTVLNYVPSSNSLSTFDNDTNPYKVLGWLRLLNSLVITTLSASPGSVTVGSTVTITAVTLNPDGGTLVYTWSAATGTVTGSGSTVTWTAPSSSGTFSITCSVSNGKNTAQKSVSVIVTPLSLAVYSDSGLLGEGTHSPDIVKWGSGGNSGLAEQTGGGASGDTLKFMRDTSGSESYVGWGVTLDKNDAAYKRDMSSFASGYIKFYLKTDRALSGSERVFINVVDISGKSLNILIGAGYGWTSGNSAWQEVSVPVTAVTGINLADVHLPFEITVDSLTSSITMDVDNVRWTTGLSSSGTNHAPELSWTGESGYTSDGLDPETGTSNTVFVYLVKYTDADNNAPKSGYPQVHILKNSADISGSPFTMTYVSGASGTGAIYSYSRTLSSGTDYTYYFKAYDVHNSTATGTPLTSINSPDVILYTGANSSPIIASLIANPASVMVGSTSTITCSASDPNGDTLTYTWSITSGTKSGTGSQIAWTAPNSTGTFSITCTVSDGNGGSASQSVNVTVTPLVVAIYSDVGLCPSLVAGTTHIPDIISWGAGNPQNPGLLEQTGDGASGDTAKFMRDSSVENWFGWGIIISTDTACKRNMSSFSSGHLRLYLKTNRPLDAGPSLSVDLGLAYGWDSNNSSWQEVSVPISALSGVNLANIKIPFIIATASMGSSITIDVDNVRWTKD